MLSAAARYCHTRRLLLQPWSGRACTGDPSRSLARLPAWMAIDLEVSQVPWERAGRGATGFSRNPHNGCRSGSARRDDRRNRQGFKGWWVQRITRFAPFSGGRIVPQQTGLCVTPEPGFNVGVLTRHSLRGEGKKVVQVRTSSVMEKLYKPDELAFDLCLSSKAKLDPVPEDLRGVLGNWNAGHRNVARHTCLQ